MEKFFIILYAMIAMANEAICQTYKYDTNNQIVEIKYDNGFTITIQYDANGNRISYTASNSPLPIILLSFNAEKSGEQVLLTWSTAQEINTSNFEIEYSKDALVFTSFSIVQAKGSSSVRSNYSTLHCCPIEGVNYYRLKMIDKDGSFKYSEIRKIVFDFINTMKVYPNPTSSQSIFSISFKKSFSENVNVNIYSSDGALVYNSILSKGGIILQVNTSKFAGGTYNIVVITPKKTYKGTFVKQ